MELIRYNKIKEQLKNESYNKMSGILEYVDSFNNLSDEKIYVLKVKDAILKYDAITGCDLNSTGYETKIGKKNAIKYSEKDLAKITAIRGAFFQKYDIINIKTGNIVNITPASNIYFVSYSTSGTDSDIKYQEYLNKRKDVSPSPDFEKTYTGYSGGLFSTPLFYCRSFLYKKNQFSISE